MRAVKNRVPGRKFILRPYRRIPTWYHSHYLSGDVIGKGVVMNLSCSGMRILGDHRLTPGTELSLRVCLDEHGSPLHISCASVQWVNQYEFGLKINHLTPDAERRITNLLKEHISIGRHQ